MAEYKLKLQNREVAGKKSKDLRKSGLIPAVVYGGKAPILVAGEYVPMEKVLEKAGYHSPIDLDIDGKKRMVIVKDVQIDPVSRMILNVEFQAISAKEVVEATTPIVVMNFEESEAAKTYHLAIQQGLTEVAVKAKPADLPKELTIDAAKLEQIEDKLTLAEIKLPEGVEYADKELDLEQVVVSLYDPAAEAEKREAEEAAAAEAEEAEGEATEEAETAGEETEEAKKEEE
ncbi:MAG: 50S ribosomal protein L25 [Candidatus Saccharibacteria bacterium]|nr:50S ribosomal protein L25 [Candidatus Saccharibacteria bacterium]